MKLFRILFLFMSIAMLHSCADDIDDVNPIPENEAMDDMGTPNPEGIIRNAFNPDFVQNFGTEITRDFFIKVIDKTNNRLDGVTITIGNESTITDNNGIATLLNASVFETFGYVKAEKEGYIHASRSVVPTDGVNEVTIMMLSASPSGIITSGQVARVGDGSGATVTLNGAYSQEDGSDYTGDVKVVVHRLDPVDPQMTDQMPGMLYAQDYDGAEQMLETLGMIAVELRDTNNNKLNIAGGSVAEISLPVDPSLLSLAPATIPLWYFDETNGLWIEEGEATLENGAYVGAVTHFSFWNCDIPVEAINLCVNLSNENGLPAGNHLVKITSATNGSGTGVSNGDGQVCGLVPANQVLTIEVFSNVDCEPDPVFTGSIGPFTVDDSIAITVSMGTIATAEQITGIFNDCDGNPVTNGYVVVNYDSNQIETLVTDGIFDIILSRCPDQPNMFTYYGVDLNGFETSDTQSAQFTMPTTTLPTISSCNEISEFYSFTVDTNDPVVFIENLDYDTFGASGFVMSSFEQNNNLSVQLPEMTPGTYMVNDPGVFFFMTDNQGNLIKAGFNNENIVINLVNFGAVGEFIDITFSGTFDNGNGGPQQTIVGEMHKIRPF